MNIGQKIKKVRKALGLTQQELADKVGISRNTQVNYESGKRDVNSVYLNLLSEISKSFGIKASFFDEEADVSNSDNKSQFHLHQIFLTKSFKSADLEDGDSSTLPFVPFSGLKIFGTVEPLNSKEKIVLITEVYWCQYTGHFFCIYQEVQP